MYIYSTPMTTPRFQEYIVLTPTEEKVLRYVVAQEQGVSISQISRGVDLARTSIYSAVALLEKKKVIVKKGFTYLPLQRNLRPRKESGATAKKQIEDLLQETLTLKRGEVLFSIESDEEIKELLDSEGGLPAWQKAAADKGIVLKSIGSIQALAYFRTAIDEKLGAEIKRRSGAARFMTDVIPGSCTLVSFRDSVVFFSRKNDLFYRIDNADVAHFTQSIIEFLYMRLQYHKLIME